ncbi:PREDICTED: tubulin--tyrosine ligase-like protein 12 [Poecilia mexicana]|uniref:tubulin--tyrosine ligase-like protein 12 n=1 Tax=Poecilia mexicana TaxID=48701 RepID=UPI00072E84AA|nr:PREDICTED: tubulin--tyrosine ligase-like protein 12 [Poecilia mexicana]
MTRMRGSGPSWCCRVGACSPQGSLRYTGRASITRSPTSIFLVDHAWTYRVEHAREQLEQIPGLLPRMASLMGVDFHGEVPPPDVVELILERMWKYNQTYQLSQGSAEEKAPVWYIMDEFGSQVQHSDHPSCCMAPFFYMQGQLAYTLLWPLQDLQGGGKDTT